MLQHLQLPYGSAYLSAGPPLTLTSALALAFRFEFRAYMVSWCKNLFHLSLLKFTFHQLVQHTIHTRIVATKTCKFGPFIAPRWRQIMMTLMASTAAYMNNVRLCTSSVYAVYSRMIGCMSVESIRTRTMCASHCAYTIQRNPFLVPDSCFIPFSIAPLFPWL